MGIFELLVYLSMEPNCISGLSLGLMRAVTLESECPSVCARFALSMSMRIIVLVHTGRSLTEGRY